MKKFFSVILCLFCILLGTGCEAKDNGKVFRSLSFLGTEITFVGFDKNADMQWEYLKNIASETENAVSLNKESDIVAFNRSIGGKIEIGKITFDLLNSARFVYEKTNGYYNPAIGLLVDLWGFTARFSQNDYIPTEKYDRVIPFESIPDSRYIEAFLQLTDFSQVTTEHNDNAYFVYKPISTQIIDDTTYTMHLDLSGIAKGYVADRFAEYMNENSSTGKYYAAIGSSSLVLGKNQKEEPWDVGIRNPRGEGAFATFKVENSGVSTSGDYENHYFIGDKRYCHIIDPFRGFPTDSTIISATVCGASAAECDAISTALCAMEYQKAAEFCRTELNDFFVCLVNSDGTKYVVTTYGESDFRQTGEIGK